jgi:thiol-disulfide isomerase/thioredoxin
MKPDALSVLILAAAALSAAAPRATLQPAEPKWGDRLQLVYLQDAPDAKLAKGSPIVAIVTIWYPETIEQQRIKLEDSGANPHAGFVVPQGASYIDAAFVNRDAYDGAASTKVYDAAGKPARGAWGESIVARELKKNYMEPVAKELALYPDNWTTYRNKWFVATLYDAGTLPDTLRTDLALIEREAKDRPVTALYALSYGYLLQKRFDDSRNVIAEMAKRFPDAWLTNAAIGSYAYQAFVDHRTGDDLQEVNGWAKAIYQRHPESLMARSSLDTIGAGQELSLEAVETICRRWIEDQPENPKPYLLLEERYKKAGVHSVEALALAEKSLDLLAAGQLRLHGDLYGQMTELLVPGTYKGASELALANGQFGKALAYARFAETTGKQTDPAAFVAEAAVWEALGRVPNQQDALRQAWQRGDQSALAKLPAGTAPLTPAPQRKPGPSLDFTTLDGAHLDSAQLRGKVVVANFWFTGCGPCKAEMPDLNKLVAEFRGKDVVFLAFTTDDDLAKLGRFLKEYPFDYTIVPKADKIAAQFGIENYPSHVVLRQDGTVESLLAGGGEGRAQQLKIVIDRLLAEGTR